MSIKSALAPIVLSIFCLMAPFAAHSSEGGSHGGGGAGICINGRCVGLAEAGFRIPPAQQSANGGYQVDLETMKQLDLIGKLVPTRLTTSQVIGGPETIVPLEVSAASRAKSFLDKYKKMISRQGQKDLAKNAVLLAFTIEKKTFLLMERYLALSSPRSRALLLIHEYVIRLGRTQEEAVRFDGALIDALSAVETGRPMSGRAFLIAALGAGLVEKSDLTMQLLGENISSSTGPINSETVQFETSQQGIRFNYESLLRARTFMPSIANDIEPWSWIPVVPSRLLMRNEVMLSFLYSVRNEMNRTGVKTISVTQKMFDDYMKIQTKFWSDTIMTCGSIESSVSVLKAYGTNGILQPVLVQCDADSVYQQMFPKMVGAQLNDEGRAYCEQKANGTLLQLECGSK